MENFKTLIDKSSLRINKFIFNIDELFAHTRSNPSQYESLQEHTELSSLYFCNIVYQNNLEPIIDNLINASAKQLNSDKLVPDRYLNELKLLFYYAIYMHDFGKVNPLFQKKKLKNPFFSSCSVPGSSNHSALSASIYYNYCYKNFAKGKDDNWKIIITIFIYCFSFPIINHHGNIKECNHFFDKINDPNLVPFYKYLNDYKSFDNINEDDIINIVSKTESYELFCLIKLLSSLLTISDYYATADYVNNIKTSAFGVLNSDIVNKIISGIENIPYNKFLFSNFGVVTLKSFSNLQESNNKNLNQLRQKLSSDVINNLRINNQSRLFYIEAPTGSGKTNLSLLAIREILKKRTDINKLFYVFPFTNLITQSFDFIKDKLELNDNEIAQLHSKAIPLQSVEQDDNYGSEVKLYMDNMFFNYPITILSHVSFFEILTSYSKNKNYIFHRLANSIVVIDELQAYSPVEWDKINFVINRISEIFNITFILMSATLPKISSLRIESAYTNDNFVSLTTDKHKYFSNPNFSKRVEFETRLLKNVNGTYSNRINIPFLIDEIALEAKRYYEINNRAKILVGFVKKKTAQEFFSKVKIDKRFSDFTILIITGNIIEPRRKEIIDHIKNNITSKIILIATQVIEAGLDIDMDFGYKDISILDAIEQFAGRINRNCNKIGSKLFLFNTGDASIVYRSDLRAREFNDFSEETLNILQKKDFDTYYGKVLKRIQSSNKDKLQSGNLSEYVEYIYRLNYLEASRNFKLLKDDSISVFVPLKVPVNHFSNHIELLKLLGINVNKGTIDGAEIWSLYKKIISDKETDFVLNNINFNRISAVMSNFCFSIFKFSALLKQLCNYGELEDGYFNLYNYKEVYSYEDGLFADIETDSNFL